ncbi:bifunctional adenosylcobinamide kinase/adenosylcobinamide-phosphate guanylyltransferase [Streptacidiphilus sp. EB129]|uniref:bifunctional adenosylcobinamide kinase/adenosylcobinamide-phosphate guanylyltransferase n=1 Tax=Streptacidiphilus sp. EB129 TaxID=3156262 RepID=UPI0035194B20
MRIFSEHSPSGTRRFGLEFGRRPAPPRRTLVLGGARSGKSVTAEAMMTGRQDVLYVATGGSRDGDEDWAQRVGLHRDRRPAAWGTAETCALEPLLAEPGGPLLIDCLALWLTSVMDDCDAWDDAAWAGHGRDRLRTRTAALVEAWRTTPRRVVAVSNEVGSGVVPATVSGRRFRDELGRLNAAVASASDDVLLVVAGQALPLKGPGR